MTEKADVTKAMDMHVDEVIALTQDLVRIPSENWETRGREGDCQHYVSEWMKGIFDEVDVFTPAEVHGLDRHPAFWPGRDYTNRPYVVGVL